MNEVRTKLEKENAESAVATLVIAVVIAVVAGVLAATRWQGQDGICEQVAGKNWHVSRGICYRLNDGSLERLKP